MSHGAVPAENSILIVLTRWNNILEIDPKNLTVTLQPGVVTAHLQKETEKHKPFFQSDPGNMNTCIIGGNVANNAGGLRGLKYTDIDSENGLF